MTRIRPPKDTDAPRPGRRRVFGTWSAHLLLGAVAYVPLLLTAPGRVGADTKAYLYLDPTRWLNVSASMWDPDLAMGSVTHEYIGYLLPMGPYFALTHVLGVPTWVAQRLWTGSLLFFAGAGVLFLLRTLSPSTGRPGEGSLDMGTVGGLGAVVAALGYMLSPYVLQYEARANRSSSSPGWACRGWSGCSPVPCAAAGGGIRLFSRSWWRWSAAPTRHP